MNNYTLGFIFTPSLDRVLLVHKISPEWQAGKINGIGGKIEEGEDPLTCIVRETQEEAALITNPSKWVYLGEMGSDTWRMHVFALIYDGNINDAKSADKEKVEWFDPNALPPDVIISNLHWLVPLTIDRIKHQEFESFSVKYRQAPYVRS